MTLALWSLVSEGSAQLGLKVAGYIGVFELLVQAGQGCFGFLDDCLAGHDKEGRCPGLA
jgi:hypothetical protein